MPDDAMNVTRKPAMKVGYASEKKPVMVGGRRDFFAYRDLGIGEASGGTMRGQVMKAKTGMTQPTGWHYHVCEDQFVYVSTAGSSWNSRPARCCAARRATRSISRAA